MMSNEVVTAFCLSPIAKMHMEDGRITMLDVLLSFQKRDQDVQVSPLGAARAFRLKQDVLAGNHFAEFHIYPHASNSGLINRLSVPHPFYDFIQGIDFEELPNVEG